MVEPVLGGSAAKTIPSGRVIHRRFLDGAGRHPRRYRMSRFGDVPRAKKQNQIPRPHGFADRLAQGFQF
jgi:hypothetical protein